MTHSMTIAHIVCSAPLQSHRGRDHIAFFVQPFQWETDLNTNGQLKVFAWFQDILGHILRLIANADSL